MLFISSRPQCVNFFVPCASPIIIMVLNIPDKQIRGFSRTRKVDVCILCFRKTVSVTFIWPHSYIQCEYIFILAEVNSDLDDVSCLHIDGLVQERRNSIANALELRLPCTNPSIYTHCLPAPPGICWICFIYWQAAVARCVLSTAQFATLLQQWAAWMYLVCSRTQMIGFQ